MHLPYWPDNRPYTDSRKYFYIYVPAELETAGLTEIDYEGSTLEPAGYGERIILQIHGKLGGHYEIREKRVSTAKN